MGETTAVRSWGEPPLAALPPQDRNGALSALRIKFATGRTSASLFPVP
ncbi:hypothetical protein [Moorena sp. SIO4G3]|nr:hypothetical protein [Moorena sp. SIO4G3]NEO77501.1 hypothetical protein [Moorena sp. SIO4G3]